MYLLHKYDDQQFLFPQILLVEELYNIKVEENATELLMEIQKMLSVMIKKLEAGSQKLKASRSYTPMNDKEAKI